MAGKISELSAVTAALDADELEVNEAGTSKKMTVAQLRALLQTLGMPRVKQLGTQHDNSTTTGTEVTDLSIALEVGTYVYEYTLIVRSASTTTGVGLGINFTGTAARQKHWTEFHDAGGLSTGTGVQDDVAANPGNMISGATATAFSTIAPNMVASGVSATGVDILEVVKGIIVVSASGDLELWHASETAAQTSIMVGSSLVVTRTA